MSKVCNPLLSLGAHGSIAHRLTFERRRNQAHAVRYAKPSGPPSSGQVLCRSNMSVLSASWSYIFSQEAVIASWDLSARRESKTLTGANVFIRSALSLSHDGDVPGFVSAVYAVGRVPVFAIMCPYSGDPSDESGNFTVRAGATPDLWSVTVARLILAGIIIGPVAAVAGLCYYQLFKDGVPRSGIISLTHNQSAVYEDLLLAGVTWDQLFVAGITWEDLQ